MCEHAKREEAMTVLARNDEGKPTIWCDPCIAPLVQALNDGGLRTVASCCGHEHRPGYVILADDRKIYIMDEEWGEHISTAIHDRVGCKPGYECEACATERGTAFCGDRNPHGPHEHRFPAYTGEWKSCYGIPA